MANTFAYGQNTLGISAMDSDFNLATLFPAGAVVIWLFFKPGAVNDKIDIRDGEGGPALLCGTDTTGNGLQTHPWIPCIPFLDYSACTLSSGAEVTIAWE